MQFFIELRDTNEPVMYPVRQLVWRKKFLIDTKSVQDAGKSRNLANL